MSTDADRDLEAELEGPRAGRSGIPVDAVCTGCGRVRAKRAEPEEMGEHPQVDTSALEAGDLLSFKHVCHPCGTVTWWNPIAVLTGLIESDGDDDEPRA